MFKREWNGLAPWMLLARETNALPSFYMRCTQGPCPVLRPFLLIYFPLQMGHNGGNSLCCFAINRARKSHNQGTRGEQSWRHVVASLGLEIPSAADLSPRKKGRASREGLAAGSQDGRARRARGLVSMPPSLTRTLKHIDVVPRADVIRQLSHIINGHEHYFKLLDPSSWRLSSKFKIVVIAKATH